MPVDGYPDRRAATAVVLPGSGSDDVFVRTAFAGPLRALGIALVAPAPRPGRGVVAGYRAALDEALAATTGPLLVGGVSLGAHEAAAWAVERAGCGRLAGLLLALPAWTGAPGAAPAAQAATATAVQVRAGGTAAAVAAARAGAPGWLADELARAWRGYGAGLADALDEAACRDAPDAAALRSIAVPVGLAGLADDPVHPLAVARGWERLLPRAVLCTSTMDAFGADPAVLGRAAVLGWLRACAGLSRGGAGPPSPGGRTAPAGRP